MQQTIIKCDRCGDPIESLREETGNRIMSLYSTPYRREDDSWELCKNCIKELKVGLKKK